MAGSWDHMTDDEGRLLPPGRWQIENLGDAYETAEECYGMVQWLADHLALARAGNTFTRDSVAANRRRLIEEARRHSRVWRSAGRR